MKVILVILLVSLVMMGELGEHQVNATKMEGCKSDEDCKKHSGPVCFKRGNNEFGVCVKKAG